MKFITTRTIHFAKNDVRLTLTAFQLFQFAHKHIRTFTI